MLSSWRVKSFWKQKARVLNWSQWMARMLEPGNEMLINHCRDYHCCWPLKLQFHYQSPLKRENKPSGRLHFLFSFKHLIANTTRGSKIQLQILFSTGERWSFNSDMHYKLSIITIIKLSFDFDFILPASIFILFILIHPNKASWI